MIHFVSREYIAAKSSFLWISEMLRISRRTRGLGDDATKQNRHAKTIVVVRRALIVTVTVLNRRVAGPGGGGVSRGVGLVGGVWVGRRQIGLLDVGVGD